MTSTPYYAELAAQSAVSQTLMEWYKSLAIEPRVYTIHTPDQKLIPANVLDYILSSGLTIDNAKFFRSSPRYLGIVHKDADGRKCALNIPVSVPQAAGVGLMQWYDDNPAYKSIKHTRKGSIWVTMPGPQDMECTDVTLKAAETISQAYMSTQAPSCTQQMLVPSVVSTNIWHRVDNSRSQEERLIYSVRFRQNPSLEALAETFRRKG